jgi:hypothetical protein
MQHRIDLLWKNQENTKLTIAKTRIAEIEHFNAYAATLGITQKKVFILDIEASIEIQDFQLKKFRGVEIQILPGQEHKSLVIILLEDSLFQTFGHLVDDIINGIIPLNNGEDAVKKIFKIIRQWRRLFDKADISGLTVEQQKGLYGELLIVKQLIKHGISANLIINSWSGPDKKNQDFMFQLLSIEVKTTVVNHPIIKITNEHQLDSRSPLCLVLVVLNEKRGKQNTLPALVSELKQLLSDIAPESLEIFEDKLSSLNYYDSDRDKYALTEYDIRHISAYNVIDDFPRITPGNTVQGIFSISYQIETSACSQFLVDFPDFILQSLNHENSN